MALNALGSYPRRPLPQSVRHSVQSVQSKDFSIHNIDYRNRCTFYAIDSHQALSWHGSDYQVSLDSEFSVQKEHLALESLKLPPGENNPNAIPGGKLCFDYINKGR